MKELNQGQVSNTHFRESFFTHLARVFGFVGENPCEAECIWGITPIFWERLKSCKFKPPRSTSYCYQLVELTDTTTCKLRIHRLLLSLDSHQLQAPPLVYSLNFNGSNYFDHQGLENISSLKTLSLCKKKLL